MAESLNDADAIPVRVVHKPVVTQPRLDPRAVLEANATSGCVGVMRLDAHVFARRRCGSPVFARCRSRCSTSTPSSTAIFPWGEIDMDFMNLNQSAHGDREFGFIANRMGLDAQDSRRALADPTVVGPDRNLVDGRPAAGTRRRR